MRILFIITLTACLFYISQAQAHEEQKWITKKPDNGISSLHCDTQDIIDRLLDILEAQMQEREDKKRKCWSLQEEYRNEDCPPLYMKPMTGDVN